MEKEFPQNVITETEFLELIQRAQGDDKEAMLQIIELYEQEMIDLSRYIKMPKEDALQAMITGLIELIKRGRTNV
ncbi:helix-turn-helix domain-containing protein [Paenibacillus apiarius]|uniref:Helix-turn-helix domain-containing protein n=1 Tax=Paenibacillus apiarius TaxID=46240 RepID=A0ABT4DXX5_9BACL|nr:helix-turn-helix domain-containing protein [Paenibacillus apiarius]MBN3525201.1 helix-turn-helix domain-containing protein [Paenibacillus apiarius]MCY9517533.1 helix-turn-helix domain-containing protein [Paenibacillus apiarius]MCY9522188.1 helix-turn-helix domain-containing protein [Paenibacillus apiarius]MCY9552222.1 helix-turn-helix domain-containing protein [Paenibacillus apiarius]MCY9560101.1 helix-turn-helix domain-containing protein [Paenibacillus apiarius]